MLRLREWFEILNANCYLQDIPQNSSSTLHSKFTCEDDLDTFYLKEPVSSFRCGIFCGRPFCKTYSHFFCSICHTRFCLVESPSIQPPKPFFSLEEQTFNLVFFFLGGPTQQKHKNNQPTYSLRCFNGKQIFRRAGSG